MALYIFTIKKSEPLNFQKVQEKSEPSQTFCGSF